MIVTNLYVIGYGKLGKAVCEVSKYFPEMEVKKIFTRRKEEVRKEVNEEIEVLDVSDIEKEKYNKNTVAILCNSSSDILEQIHFILQKMNVILTFDEHKKIIELLEEADVLAKKAKTVSIFTGWDPGLYSNIRDMFASLFPEGEIFTLWGDGSSRGHAAEAKKRTKEWVSELVQYTIRKKEEEEKILRGEEITDSSPPGLHRRVVYLALKPGMDTEEIRKEVKERISSIPGYYREYEVEFHFVSKEEMKKNHSSDPHGGKVIGRTLTKDGGLQVAEFRLQLANNPEFTARTCLRATIAAVKKARKGDYGAFLENHISQAECSLETLETLKLGGKRNNFV